MESLLCAWHIASPLRIRFLPHPFPAQPFCAMFLLTGRPRLFPVTRPKIPRVGRPFGTPASFFTPFSCLPAPSALRRKPGRSLRLSLLFGIARCVSPGAFFTRFAPLFRRPSSFFASFLQPRVFPCPPAPLFAPTARTLFPHYPIIIVVGYGALPHVHHWPLTFPHCPPCAASPGRAAPILAESARQKANAVFCPSANQKPKAPAFGFARYLVL